MRLKNEDKILPRLRAGKPIAQIARDLGISKQALYKNLATLEKHGKIRRLGGGKYQVIDESVDQHVKKRTTPKPEHRTKQTGQQQLPRLVRWKIRRCQELLRRKRTLPREDPIKELIHLGVLRVRRDRYEVRTKEFPVLFYNFVAEFANEISRMKGNQFRLPKAPKDQVTITYIVDFADGVWKAKDLAKLGRWESPETRRLLRAYVSHLKDRYSRSSPA